MHYANNFLTIAPRHIMAVGGQSETLQQRFREAGVNVEWIPLENLISGYGAAHCMTQVLRRATYTPSPTAVSAVEPASATGTAVYNLNGQRLPSASATRGIYVDGGRKKIGTGR